MALHRKKRFDTPVKCSVCKERRAYHTVHGGLIRGGGRTICDDCYKYLQAEEHELHDRMFDYTEADYQTWMRL